MTLNFLTNFFLPSVCILQLSTARIPVYQPTQSGRAKLSTGTSLSEPWCPTTAIPAITSSGHRSWPASRWVTGTSHYQNAWVRLCGFSPNTLFLIILTLYHWQSLNSFRRRGRGKMSQVSQHAVECSVGFKELLWWSLRCLCKSLQSFPAAQTHWISTADSSEFNTPFLWFAKARSIKVKSERSGGSECTFIRDVFICLWDSNCLLLSLSISVPVIASNLNLTVFCRFPPSYLHREGKAAILLAIY